MRLFPKILLLAVILAADWAHADMLVHLTFDGNTEDISGHQNNGICSNGVSFDSVNFKLGGAAVSFNGSNFISVPDFVPAIGNRSRSVSFWERSTSTNAPSPNEMFFGWGNPAGVAVDRYELCLENGDNTRLRNEFNLNAVVSTANSVNFRDGEWHHILATYDSTVVRLFVDGKSYGKELVPKQKLNTGARQVGMVIGCGIRQVETETESARRFFHGEMDDLGIWNHALNPVDAALINGLGCIGDNDLRWLPAARMLWEQNYGDTIIINHRTWMKVKNLAGETGSWGRGGGPNSIGSYIILDGKGDGLRITPAWRRYNLWWLSGLAAWTFGAVMFVGWLVGRMRMRMRVRRLELLAAREDERRRIAQDLHDDLGSGLTEIIQLGDLSCQECRSMDDLQKRLALITQKNRTLVSAVDEIVWMVNPRNDNIPKLAGYCSDYAQEFFAYSAVRCRLDLPGDLPNLLVPAATRHHFFLAFKEALNNVAKHSGAAEVWIRIRFENGWLTVLVEDNGRGFDASAPSQRNGLTNMKSRIEEVGGKFVIRSEPGRGTTVEFALLFQEPPVS